MRVLIPLLIIIVLAGTVLAADDLSFTQRAELEQRHYNEIRSGRKAALKEWNSAVKGLPAEAFDSDGGLKRDNPDVVRATEVYNKRMEEVGRSATANYQAEAEALKARTQGGVNALRAEKARLKLDAFNQHEARLRRQGDGSVDRKSAEFKRVKAELKAEWARIDAEMEAKDAKRRQMARDNFGATGDGSYKVVGELPGQLKSDADMMITDRSKFEAKLREQGGWSDYSDRKVDHANDFTAWKDTAKGSKGRQVGSSSNDAEMAFGAQQGSDSFPSSDGKRYAAGAKQYNKLNAFNSNLVKMVHSVGDKQVGAISYQNQDNVDFKTFAKSTVKGADIAGAKVDKTLSKQLKGLQKGKSLEEALDLFGHTPAQKDAKVKEFLQQSTGVARESYKRVEKTNSNEREQLVKDVEKLKRSKASAEKIGQAEKRLLQNKSLGIENLGIHGELVTINPELVGSVISDEGKIVRKTNGEFVDTKDGRVLSTSEVRERYLAGSNRAAIEASPFVGAGNKELFKRTKDKLEAVKASKTFKAVSGSYNVIELGISAVKGAERAVAEEQEGDSELKTFSKAIYYATPVAGFNDLTKASVFSGLNNYKKELAQSNSPNDTTTQALLLGKHATMEMGKAVGSFAKESVLGVLDVGESLGKFAEWATRGSTEENRLGAMDAMDKKLISYRAAHLNNLYARAKTLRSNDAEGLKELNKALADTVNQWQHKKNTGAVLARAKQLQGLLQEATPEPAQPQVIATEKQETDPFGAAATPTSDADPFATETSSETNPFGETGDDLFSDVDQDEVYRLKQQQAASKNRALRAQQSEISSAALSIARAKARQMDAMAAAAKSAQQSLIATQMQINDIQKRERAQELQNREIANRNRAAIAEMIRNNSSPSYSQTSTNGYPVSDPYAQRFEQVQQQQMQVQRNQQVQFVEPSSTPVYQQANDRLAPSSFEEAATSQQKATREKLWAIIAYLYTEDNEPPYAEPSCWVVSSAQPPLEWVSYFAPTRKDGHVQFYRGYKYAVHTVGMKEDYCQQEIIGKRGYESDLRKLHGYIGAGYGFNEPHTKNDLIIDDSIF